MCKQLILMVLMVGLALTSTARARLIGWLRLDETSGTIAADSSGQGNNGTIAGSPEWAEGKLGGAMQFSGDDSIIMPAATMGLGTNDGSVAFWVNTGAPSGINTIFWAGDNTAGGGFGPENEMHVHLEAAGTYWRGGEVSFYSQGGAFIHSDPTKGAAGSTPINPVLVGDNVWHHIAATWGGDDAMAKLFIDGVLVSSASYARPSWVISNIYLGRMANSSRFFSGLLDEVRIYNHALSESEVKDAMTGSLPGPCSSPSPADKTTDVVREAVLGWAPGKYAQTHDVYMGTVFEDVNTASRTNPLDVLVSQGQDANTFDPAGLLEFGRTYYWRIDEVNAPDKPGLYKGNTWTFTTETYGYYVKPIKATASSFSNALTSGEKTIDGSGLDALGRHSTSASTMWLSKKAQSPVWIKYEFDRVYSLYQMWVWNQNQLTELDSGYGAKDVTIEVSTDGTTWTTLAGVPEFAQATGEESYVHNTTVDFGGALAKFVRLNISSNWGDARSSGLAEVRFFYVPVKAFGPTPATGSMDVAVDEVLNWRAGRTAAGHEVYLGADPNALSKVGTVTDHRYSLASAGVEYDQTYYWRINEVNDAQTPKTWEGDVWSFSTPSTFVVEDFESYDDICRRIFYTWVDGYGATTTAECGGVTIPGNGSGSAVGNPSTPYAERSIVHGGKQSLPLFFDNPGATSYSETTRTFAVPQDWILGGIKTLVLYFHGDSTNAAGQFYVKINNTKVVYNGKSDVLTTPFWKQWNIDLASVSGNLRSVGSLTIGVSGSGKGVVYIDDIQLYRTAPAVAQPVDPGTTNRMAYYTMEGDAKDGSGRGYNGTLVGEPVFINGEAGYGQSLLFDGVNDYVDLPIAPLLGTLTSATFTARVNFDSSGNTGWERVFDFGTGETVYMFLTLRQGTTGLMRAGITLTGNTNQSNVDAGVPLPMGWHHVAVVIDGSTKIMQICLDGSPVGSGPTTLVPKDLGTTTQNWLGRSQWTADGYYKGMMDDFAIYDRALSEGELRYLAGDR